MATQNFFETNTCDTKLTTLARRSGLDANLLAEIARWTPALIAGAGRSLTPGLAGTRALRARGFNLTAACQVHRRQPAYWLRFAGRWDWPTQDALQPGLVLMVPQRTGARARLVLELTESPSELRYYPGRSLIGALPWPCPPAALDAWLAQVVHTLRYLARALPRWKAESSECQWDWFEQRAHALRRYQAPCPAPRNPFQNLDYSARGFKDRPPPNAPKPPPAPCPILLPGMDVTPSRWEMLALFVGELCEGRRRPYDPSPPALGCAVARYRLGSRLWDLAFRFEPQVDLN